MYSQYYKCIAVYMNIYVHYYYSNQIRIIKDIRISSY